MLVVNFTSRHFNICYITAHPFRYLQEEWNAKKLEKEGVRSFSRDTMPGACPECPQQSNFSDCGIYILQYVESLFSVSPLSLLGSPQSTYILEQKEGVSM